MAFSLQLARAACRLQVRETNPPQDKKGDGGRERVIPSLILEVRRV